MFANSKSLIRHLIFFLLPFFSLSPAFYLSGTDILIPYYQWTGSRSTSNGGISTLGDLSTSGFEFSWSITETAPSVFHYVYTLTPVKESSFSNSDSGTILLGISQSVSSGQSLPNSNSVYNLSKASFSGKGPYLRQTYNNGNPNYLTSYQYIGSSSGTVNPTGSLYGFSVTPQATSASSISFSFDSAFSPIWGSFYASSSSGANVAQNVGLTTTGMLPSVSSDYIYYVAIPGSNNHVISPEPSTYIILGSCLVFAAYIKRRRLRV